MANDGWMIGKKRRAVSSEIAERVRDFREVRMKRRRVGIGEKLGTRGAFDTADEIMQ